ncbi:Malto-oligosyltrehalose trehalohydrolase [Moorella humiferrea]|uniref:malto-oligosyltrehalose trehalohydrolase n=1 Tax=Neomoorella humiferrea TaxID=676965 RepID=UPI0030D33CF9
MAYGVTLGATYLGQGRCRFRLWAPLAREVAVRIVAPTERVEFLNPGERGYYEGEMEGVEPGSLYYYILDGQKLPDPASRFQPQGVHGPSQVMAKEDFLWSDTGWRGPIMEELIFYELHVGTFTPEGTFEAVIPHLGTLTALGVTAVELMPVAQFPGSRNWGYDGVFPFAVQASYGGPDGLRRLVNACHGHGLAVFLDVVYNHLGPEGNYLARFGPYFTERYRTPWGPALNFDGPGSDEVRRFFIENALYWLIEFHIDGLRLDAVHAIMDNSAMPFLEELASAVKDAGERLGRRVYLIAESDLNDPRLIRPSSFGGYDLDAQWCDDFHHALHALLTGERNGYYRDFGSLGSMARALKTGYVYTGQYSAYRQRRHGRHPHLTRGDRLVVFVQNHDQVGNRARGERLSVLVPFARLKLAAAVVLLSPFIPLLFMGEEYAETAPFLYFTSHSDPQLAAAVREGRRQEFADHNWEGEVPDPQEEATFLDSRLNFNLRRQGRHGVLWEFYRQLIQLRRQLSPLAELNLENMEVIAYEQERVLFVRRWSDDSEVSLIFSFNDGSRDLTLPLPPGRWQKRLDAAEERWLGDGSPAPAMVVSPGEVQIAVSPWSCLLYERLKEACAD